MIVVDAHCHVGIGHEYRQSAADLLAEMDRWQVDRAVICPVDRCLAEDNRQSLVRRSRRGRTAPGYRRGGQGYQAAPTLARLFAV